MGELAHVSVPDLKEAEGGLRDATVLKALVATWLVDVPHADLERSRLALLDVRDVLHEVAGRATDRVAPDAVGRAGARPRAGRRRGRAATRARARPADRPPVPADVAAYGRGAGAAGVHRRARGVPSSSSWRPASPCRAGEVVLSRGRRPGARPAAAAARRGGGGRARRRARARHRRAAGARRAPTCPTRGPTGRASCSCGCSASGRGLRAVWETLEETGALDRLLPEWERIRLLPHASVDPPVHRRPARGRDLHRGARR